MRSLEEQNFNRDISERLGFTVSSLLTEKGDVSEITLVDPWGHQLRGMSLNGTLIDPPSAGMVNIAFWNTHGPDWIGNLNNAIQLPFILVTHINIQRMYEIEHGGGITNLSVISPVDRANPRALAYQLCVTWLAQVDHFYPVKNSHKAVPIDILDTLDFRPESLDWRRPE